MPESCDEFPYLACLLPAGDLILAFLRPHVCVCDTKMQLVHDVLT